MNIGLAPPPAHGPSGKGNIPVVRAVRPNTAVELRLVSLGSCRGISSLSRMN